MPKSTEGEPKNAEKPELVTVVIPDRDLFDQPHPGVRLNHTAYGPGVHRLAPDIAHEIEDRLARFNHEQVRVLQPTIDRKSVKIANSQGRATLPAVG